MAKVAIVYHSGFGHTKVQAEAVHRGASRVKNVEAVLIPIEEYETHWEALDRADAIVMGAPTYMAGASAQFKAFLDATSSRWAEQRWKDKLAAGFTNSAGHNGDAVTHWTTCCSAPSGRGTCHRSGTSPRSRSCRSTAARPPMD